ncbi:hypothetical protein G6F68_017760 [Rhizopus microsporus]|nr:hypothetical protein G6F68_017760 [Rhizopus microsporus]
MPAASAPSALGSVACTRTVREPGSTCGSTVVICPENSRPAWASTVTVTDWPVRNAPSACSGKVMLAYSVVASVSETSGSPALANWPRLTRRTPSTPSNGAFTRFCSINACTRLMSAAAWS